MLMGMGVVGWIVSFAAGFALGGVFFLSMKLQVEYVVQRRGPTWLVPAALYARMALLAAVLVLVALLVREKQWQGKLPAMMLAGVAGVMVARVLIARMIGKQTTGDGCDARDD